MAHVEVVVPVFVLELVEGARVVGRRIRSVGAARGPVALAERVLHVHRKALRRATVQGEHQRVVAVMAAAGLEIDLGVRILDTSDLSGRIASDDRELANDERCVCRVRVRDDLGDLVRNAAQEQIAPLAAYIRCGCAERSAQILLDRRGVLVHLLWNRVVAVRTRAADSCGCSGCPRSWRPAVPG